MRQLSVRGGPQSLELARVGLAEQLEAERRRAAEEQTRMDGSVRAMRLLSKLTSSPDSADVFREFDADGDGTITRGELQAGFKTHFGEARPLWASPACLPA
jgi:hypothetical protein